MATYRAQDLANRITNVFFIAGSGLPKESYPSTTIYNYKIGGVTWNGIRSSPTSGVVGNGIEIGNRFSGTYSITRTGIQFSTTWGIVPVGMAITFEIDLVNNLPFKIRAFKGTTSTLTGDFSEYSIPLNQGLVPFSEEFEVTDIGGIILYFNQTAINAFLANPNQNLFILGEYDYNNIAPTENYVISNTDPSATSNLIGQT
jgi:hypothetical protein